MAGKGEVCAYLEKLEARLRVPGMVDNFRALLVCLCDAPGKKEGVLSKGHDVNLNVDKQLYLRDQIPLEHEEGVSVDVFGLWALKEDPRKEAVRCERQVFFPSTVLSPKSFFSLAEVRLVPVLYHG